MLIKTKSFNPIQILFLLGILFLPLHTKSQESKNKVPTTTASGTIESGENEATKKKAQTTKDNQATEVKVETSVGTATQEAQATGDTATQEAQATEDTATQEAQATGDTATQEAQATEDTATQEAQATEDTATQEAQAIGVDGGGIPADTKTNETSDKAQTTEDNQTTGVKAEAQTTEDNQTTGVKAEAQTTEDNQTTGVKAEAQTTKDNQTTEVKVETSVGTATQEAQATEDTATQEAQATEDTATQTPAIGVDGGIPADTKTNETSDKAQTTEDNQTTGVKAEAQTTKDNQTTEVKVETSVDTATQEAQATGDTATQEAQATGDTATQEAQATGDTATQTPAIGVDGGIPADTKTNETSDKAQTTEDNQTTGVKAEAQTTEDNQTTGVKAEAQTTEDNQTTGVKAEDNQTVQETPGKVEAEKEKTTLEYEAQQIKGSVIQPEKLEPEKPELQKAQTQEEKKEESKEKMDGPSVVVSRRSVQGRSPFRSPVPVDVIDSSSLVTFGNTANLTDQLNTLIPSYMASPAVVKNSAFVRPTSLRGMAGDQTLVLINGKRRHHSALVQQFGPLTNRGSQGIDIAMIPTIALKNVEILRGGASAQYGSDAMAGVINFNLKDAPDDGSIQATYGQFYEGEKSWRVGANLGFSFLENNGFANFSFDTNEADGHSRGEQDKRAFPLISRDIRLNRGAFGHNRRGNKHGEEISGVGSDAIFGDSPLVNSWGRPETTSTRFMLNSGLKLNPNTNIYLFGNYAVSDGRIRLLYRDPRDPAFMGNSRWANNLDEVRRTGFTPILNGKQEDMSAVFGMKGEIFQNTVYDFSTGFGFNTLDQRLKNSLNPDAQLYYGAAQREFNLGGYKQQEQNFNADFSTNLNKETNTNVSYGLEYREELFGQYAGSLASSMGRGPSGMMGISESEAGEYTRSNYSAYIDLEHIFRKSIFLQYSLRYDNFSDFGQTTNNKIAGLINLTPYLSLRASMSTNFKAPTLGQAHLISTVTGESITFLETNYYNHTKSSTINVPADSLDARGFGGTPLKEENSTDINIGFVAKMGDNSHLSFDGYSVTVNDRIYKKTIDQGTYEDNISFYANALDLKHQGLDVVWTTDLSKNISFANILLNVAYNYNTIDVTDNKFTGGHRVLTSEQVEDMENNYPKHNFVFTANAQTKKWGIMTRARYIGDHYGEAGTLEKRAEREDGYNDFELSQSMSPVVYLDLELSYRPTEKFTFVLGGANILDEYPGKMMKPYANLMDYGMPYSRQTVANYEGGSWYLRMLYNF